MPSNVLTVGPGQPYATIAAAVAAAQPGDTIDVQAGTYTNDFINVYQNITLQAVGGVVKLVATVSPPNAKGIIDEGGSGVNVTINGFDISGAAVGDGNGAAIRYEGGNLTLNNDYLHNNEDGLLANSDLAGSISINNSEVAYNGTGDGYTHDLYVGDIANFTITNSYIHDANEGHEVKSRAENTTITGSRIFDNSSTASYSIDLPNGGNATIQNDVIQQGPYSDNPAIIAYGEEGSLHAGTTVVISNNTIVNNRGNATGVMNRTAYAVTLQNNSVYGLTSGNLVSGPANILGTNYLASSPVLDLGSYWMASGAALSAAAVLSSATEHVALPASTKVASFTDSNLADLATGFTALINWGDGTAATAGTVSGSAGSFAVTGGHTYTDEGSDPVSVTITRTSDGSSITPTGNVLVGENDALSGTGKSLSATAGQSFSGAVASFSDTDLVTPASDLAATINWGDGTAVATGTVSGSAGSFTVSGTHTYTTAATDTVTVTLSDDAPGTAKATATGTASVAAGTSNTITIPSSQYSATENVSNATIIATSGNHMIFIGGSGDVVMATGGTETIQANQGGNKITTGAGFDTINFAGSNNVIKAGAGNNTLTDNGSNNTIVLPGAGGYDDITGNVLTNGDKLDLRPMLATTGWTGDLASIGNYVKLASYRGGIAAVVELVPSGVAGGALYGVAKLEGSGPVSLQTLLAHSIT